MADERAAARRRLRGARLQPLASARRGPCGKGRARGDFRRRSRRAHRHGAHRPAHARCGGSGLPRDAPAGAPRPDLRRPLDGQRGPEPALRSDGARARRGLPRRARLGRAGGAQAGTLTVMVGGDQAAFDRALPVFRAFGKNIKLCGPAGAGQVVKLVNQLLVGVHTAAIAEAAVFGAKLGPDPSVVLEVIGTSYGGSTMMTRHMPRFISRDFSPATPMTLILKDLGLIHDQAKGAGVPLLLGALAEQRFLEAKSRGLGDQDMSALVRLWEDAAGTKVA